jgi:hypothetical protein
MRAIVIRVAEINMWLIRATLPGMVFLDETCS